ncbi:MAG: hypothetical protein COA73_02125 [Candidatus Hydrogenedentota bacterium]|nr:MAG: hypothetical protein COA73_02125 [Candidatus Hydrogenedentota bacterium]
MKKEQTSKKSSRRGFLTSFLKELNRRDLGSSTQNREQITQASVLALHHAKNNVKLTRIAIKTPKLLEENIYQVPVSGQDASGGQCSLELHIDCTTSRVEEI